MGDWLSLRNVPQGIHFDMFVSPYNRPEAVRGFRTLQGRFRIEFRYVDGPEPGRIIAVDKNIWVTEGKHSGRLLSLEVDADAVGADMVGISIRVPMLKEQISSTWDRVLESQQIQDKAVHERARAAFGSREEDVLEQLAAPR